MNIRTGAVLVILALVGILVYGYFWRIGIDEESRRFIVAADSNGLWVLDTHINHLMYCKPPTSTSANELPSCTTPRPIY